MKSLTITLFFVYLNSLDLLSQDSSMVETNQRGLEILQSAQQAIGDVYADDLKLDIRVFTDAYTHLGQSLTPLPPFKSGTWHRTYSIDRASGTERSWEKQVMSGYVFEDYLDLNQNDGRLYHASTKTYIDGQSSWFEYLNMIPHYFLRRAFEKPLMISLESEATENGKSCYVVRSSNGRSVQKLWINKANNLLEKVVRLRMSGTYGEGYREYQFDDYKGFGNLKFATRVKYTYGNSVTGPIVNHFQVTQNTVPSFNDEELREYKPADFSHRKKAEAVRLSDKVYYINNATESKGLNSHNLLFVEFESFVLVTEAVVNTATSRKVMNIIRETVGDKPIRYLVQSHHHNDHIAGIREYIANGTTVITTDNNVELIRRMASAPYNSIPDLQTRVKAEPKFQTLDNRKTVIKEAGMRVEVYDIGPTAHANEMLITYLPEQKILFQSDMLSPGEWSTKMQLSVQLRDEIKKLGLEVDRIVGIHGRVFSREEVRLFLDDQL